MILKSDETRKGPGHHSFLQDPRSGDWFIFYHRWENQSGDGPYRGSRQVCIDRLEYDEFEGGHIVPADVLRRAATWLEQER